VQFGVAFLHIQQDFASFYRLYRFSYFSFVVWDMDKLKQQVYKLFAALGE
jgi:hypothetical protein